MNKTIFIFTLGLIIGGLSTLVFYSGKSVNNLRPDDQSHFRTSNYNPITKTTEHPTKAPEKKLSTEPDSKENPATPKEKSWDEPIIIPQSLVYNITPLAISYSGLEISAVALSGYGLNKDQAEKLLNFINRTAQELSDLEAANSSLVKDSSGNEFYEIKSFKEKGDVIEKSVSQFIDSTFSGFEDDRALVFKKQLLASAIFDDYGKTTRQISLEETKNVSGGVDLSFSLIRFEDGVEVANSTNSLKTHMLQNRYSKVVNKNKK